MSKLSWLVIVIFFSVFANITSVPSATSKKVIGSDIVTLHPIADSFLNESSPDTNYGNHTQLKIKCNSYSSYTYIMFDLSSLPSNATIIHADLWLTLTDIDGYGEWGVTVGAHYCSNNSWNETEITWNNKPDFEPNPTTSRGFWYVFLPSTDSWNITVNVQTAFSLDKKLTEVITFEQPQTEWGYACFKSREVTGVELEIEYTTRPIYTVQFESTQDIEVTSNLGNLNFESNIFALPNSALVVNGSYPTEYEGGYKFLQWETEGGVGVSNSTAQKTTVTVTGSGKLRAVGSAEVMQYLYDDSVEESTTFQESGEMVAVRFTPLFLGDLTKARFFISSDYGNTFNVHVMDTNLSDIIPPFAQTPSSTGWFEVDLSARNISLKENFYIAMEWLTDYYPRLGEDESIPNGRSFEWNGTAWKTRSGKDYMIRAVVESEVPIKPIGIISCTPLSSYVVGGRNVTVSGSISPPRIGVEVNVTYIRPDESMVVRKTLTNSTGEYTDTLMPDKVGLWKVMASWAGDEDYEGSTSFPEEFTVNKGTSSIYLSYFYPTTVTLGSSINLTGYLSPRRFATIDLEYILNEAATWITFASVNTTWNGDYSYVWTPTSITTYKVRASWEGDEVCDGSTSWERSLTVEETEDTFWVYVDSRSFDVTVTCNSTLSDFSFNKTEKKISFQLTGISETTGYCNVSFPKELLGGPYTILINNFPPHTLSETSNDEMSLYFTFNFSSICNVEITGKTVIPEFPNILLPLFTLASLFATILLRMNQDLKRSNKK